MITAIILAAGKSTRMGSPKMLLSWADITVLEHVISIFAKAEIEDILVVTGGAREQVDEVIAGCKNKYPVRSVFNEIYSNGEMLASIQCGLRQVTDKNVEAVMIGLGDQPQVEERSVQLLRDTYLQTQSPLIVPSFQMHRGHPWLAAGSLWEEILELHPPQTPRDFLNAHAKDIRYIDIDTPSILADLDTPEEYRASRP